MSRQAIGRTNAKPSTREFRVDASDQNEHIDGLPLGTRGGFLIDHYFPVDGEYKFNIRDFFFHGAGYVTKVDAAHKVVMTIDSVPVFSETLGGAQDLKDVDVRQSEAAEEMRARFMNIRVKVKAGPHKIGVSFVQRSFAESDSPLQPIAMLPEMERAPTIPGIDIAGPFNVSGVGETESRKRIFVCHPASPAEEPACAKTILTGLAAEAFRRPATEEDLKAPLAFYAMGRQAGGDFEAGIESGLTSILSSTKFLFRAERRPRPMRSPGQRVEDHRSRAGFAPLVLPLELGPGPAAHRSRDERSPERCGRADRAGEAHAGGSALRVADHQLRVPVAQRRSHRQHPAGSGADIRTSTRLCVRASAKRSACSWAASCATTTAMLRADQLGSDLPQRASGSALQRAEHSRRAVPTGEAGEPESLGSAGQGVRC